jgi:hypothetical protein
MVLGEEDLNNLAASGDHNLTAEGAALAVHLPDLTALWVDGVPTEPRALPGAV